MESLVAKNWHDAWNNLTSNPCLPALIDPVEEDFVVEEELSYDEVSACVNLFFEIADIVLARSCLKMDLWVPRHSDTEVVPILLSNELD